MSRRKTYHTAKRKTSKKAIIGWIVLAFVLIGVAAFFITSLCLANAHGVTIVEEWRQWFGIVKDAEAVALAPAKQAFFRMIA